MFWLLLFRLVKVGIKAIASDPIKVDGIDNNGIVMPIAIPIWLNAWLFVYPTEISFNGNIIAKIGCIRLVAILTNVIGVAELKIGLKAFLGEDNLPFEVKKIIIPTIVDKMQPMDSEIPAG